MVVIAIDPGTTGYISCVEAINGEINILDTAKIPYNKDRKVDHDRIWLTVEDMIVKHRPIHGLFIEKYLGTQVSGGDMISGFNIGIIYAMMCTVVDTYEQGVDIELVHPATWQALFNRNLESDRWKILHKLKKTKAKAATVIRRMIPYDGIYTRHGNVRDGLTDSLCIAIYGLHTLGAVDIDYIDKPLEDLQWT